MKKRNLILVPVLAMTAVFTVQADNDKPISFDQLPRQAQTFVQEHFSDKEVSFAKMERDFFTKSYEVILIDGSKIEFDKHGDWESIDCRKEEIPQAIVPQEILRYVKDKHPTRFIIEIERERKHYEIQLDNEIEIKFNTKFEVIEYDN
ncbi:PepSY-like domain-containing protein [Bacteroidales bacterium OttesenSCG-928-L03]|nr:PepSY-like domain-containing protein [Bacteroidales bacterium OttesenSCG-928-L03]